MFDTVLTNSFPPKTQGIKNATVVVEDLQI